MHLIQNIQALRGLAVTLVVAFHLMTIEEKYGGDISFLSPHFSFGMFGVDLFFVISGVIMTLISKAAFQSTKESLSFLVHRLLRIFPMYWFYSLFLVGVYFISPNMVNSSQGNQVDFLASFLLLPSQTLPLLMVGWTLIHEMYFYFMFF